MEMIRELGDSMAEMVAALKRGNGGSECMDMVFWSLEQRIDVLRNALDDSVWGLAVTQDTLESTICDACTAHGMSQNVVGARYADTVRATELIETAYASFHDYLNRIASLDVEFRDAQEGCFPTTLPQ